MKNLMIVGCSAFVACSCAANVCTIKPGMAGNWSQASSYVENVAPGANDVVKVAGGTDVEAMADDIRFIEEKGVGAIAFGGAYGVRLPTLTLQVEANDEVAFSGLMTNCAAEVDNKYVGTLVKNGAGTLTLTQKASIYGLRISFVVNDGLLVLPSGTTGTWNANYFRMEVNSPGVVWPTTGTSGTSASWFYGGLWGDGVISNPVARSCNVYVLQAGAAEPSVFSGRIDGAIYMYLRNSSTFLGTNSMNTASEHFLQKDCTVNMAAIGGTCGSCSNQGPFGCSAAYTLEDSPTVRYVGSGETSYARFVADSKFGSSFTLNGGDCGCFCHKGEISFADAPKDEVTLVLDGCQTNACTLASAILNGPVETRTTKLTKRGGGTWMLEENPDSQLNGLVTVEDGTLAFDTLDESGRLCALGLADGDLGGDHAILLGTETTTGTLSYVGATVASVATRTVALAGDGRLNSERSALSWSGVVSSDDKEHIFFVGGEADGVVRDIADGAGKIRVVKEGSGNWTLGGDLDFTGGVDVRAGSLVLSSATNLFTWYRYTIKEAKGDGVRIDTARLGLFNEAGESVISSVVKNADAYRNEGALAPGQAVEYTSHPSMTLYELERGSTATTYPFESVFKTESDTSFWRVVPNHSSNSNKFTPTLTNEESWVGCVVRLPADADPVTSYDVGSRWSWSDASNGPYVPQSWTLEGSVDGVSWTILDSVVSNQTAEAQNWRYAKKTYGGINKDGKAILPGVVPTTLDRGLDVISVAVGASLSAEKEIIVRKITIDASGMGMLRGVALAEGGVIDVVNAPTRGSFEVAVDLSQVTLPESYTILVNGAEDRRGATLSSDKKCIRVVAPGLILLFR